MSLSVIIPISDVLQRQKSILRMIQDGLVEKFELILVFDGVSDEEFSELASHIAIEELTIVRGKFGSPGKARNAGLLKVSQDWIAFWDSDDLPIAHSYSSLIKEETASNGKLILGDFGIIGIGDKERSLGKDVSYLKFAMFPGIWRCIFPREIVTDIEFPTNRIGEDIDFLVSVLSRNCEIKFENLHLYKYVTDHPGQITKKVDVKEILFGLESVNTKTRFCLQDRRILRENRVLIGLLALRIRMSLVKYSRTYSRKFMFMFQVFDPTLVKGVGLHLYFKAIKAIILGRS